MKNEYSVSVIARIYNGFHEKFGIPRQSGLVPAVRSTIVFEEPYRVREALRGLEGYSHIWLLWQFSDCADAPWHPTVRPPRLGGNRRVGVFATRSPFRPNAIGLSSVVLNSIEERKDVGPVLHVSGADLMDGTPIFDIKPYIAYTDSHPNAVSGFAQAFADYALQVHCPPELLKVVSPDLQQTLLDLLAQDPRPSYQHDANRIYTMDFDQYTICFKVIENILLVTDIHCGQRDRGENL
ncbi:MAG: tRNA (N6-threonylcarbamoyladenosine(37)-N6)-methyltransferase TrmO [Ruminococcaceae bacterium]|nr:tRNA (N6-threonylcarbamoyladenosine(37)-N6)-methyltransferase TrmO [Oscillospiraceae bacterium]